MKSPEETIRGEKLVNLGTAFVLLAAYGLYLVFLLKTHPDFFKSVRGAEEEHGPIEARWSVAK
jgi:Ca2+:H+ antiporter